MTGSLQVKRGIYYMTVSFKDEKGVCRQKSKSTGIPEKRGSKRKAQQMLDEYLTEMQDVYKRQPHSDPTSGRPR